jgi:hypothetical protein
MALDPNINTRESQKFRDAGSGLTRVAVDVENPTTRPIPVVSNQFTLALAFKMLSKNTSVDLTDLNKAEASETGGVVSVVFYDSTDAVIATLYYNGTSASWDEIAPSLLLEDGELFLLENGEPFLI